MNLEKDYFITKTDCELAIISQDLDFETITNELKIKPDRSFRKDDLVKSEFSSHLIKRSHNLWAIKTKTILSSSQSLTPHINYLKRKLKNKLGVLEKYNTELNLEIIISIWIETEDAGFSFSLRKEEMEFINKICSRCDYFFLVKESIQL